MEVHSEQRSRDGLVIPCGEADFSSNDWLEIVACVVVVAVAQGVERGEEGESKEKKGEERHDGVFEDCDCG